MPGSSIKGALRTVILSAEVSKNLGKYRGFNKIDKDWAGKVEREAFGNIQDSSFKGLRISDSDPLCTDCLTLCQKIDMNAGGEFNPVNIYRESLKPGTIIRFPFSTDPAVFKHGPQDILRMLYDFTKTYRECFLSRFPHIAPADTSKASLYLGGGTGYVSKTIVYPMFGYQEGLKRVSSSMHDMYDMYDKFANHHHDEDEMAGVSPHMLKMTKYRGATVEMGLCEVHIKGFRK
jgi:CRISPR-associated protein Csm5